MTLGHSWEESHELHAVALFPAVASYREGTNRGLVSSCRKGNDALATSCLLHWKLAPSWRWSLVEEYTPLSRYLKSSMRLMSPSLPFRAVCFSCFPTILYSVLVLLMCSSSDWSLAESVRSSTVRSSFCASSTLSDISAISSAKSRSVRCLAGYLLHRVWSIRCLNHFRCRATIIQSHYRINNFCRYSMGQQYHFHLLSALLKSIKAITQLRSFLTSLFSASPSHLDLLCCAASARTKATLVRTQNSINVGRLLSRSILLYSLVARDIIAIPLRYLLSESGWKKAYRTLFSSNYINRCVKW